MKKQLFLSFLCINFVWALSTNAQSNLKLCYNQPAAKWTQALPIGNGTLGGMVFGGVDKELIQLNEASLWSGGPLKPIKDTYTYTNLKPLREALLNGDYDTATFFAKRLQGPPAASYQPLGDLVIKQVLTDTNYTNYYRDLNISDATTTTRFTIDGVVYTREVFATKSDNCIIIKLTASKPNQLSLQLYAKSLLKKNLSIADNLIILKGKAPANKGKGNTEDSTGCDGMRFEIQVKATHTGGSSSTDKDVVSISKASEIVVYLTAATSFNGYDKCPVSEGKDEHLLATTYLNQAVAHGYNTIRKEHLNYYHHFFNRVSIQLGKDESNAKLPTDKRLDAYSNGGEDAGLEALYYQYGRYLLISASGTPNVPANLQGIWNKELYPPWSSGYTTNINLQMNYWAAECANLTELNEPLWGLMKALHHTGTKTAWDYYHIHGFVLHHNTDIWGITNAVGNKVGDPRWANWAMGGNWLSRHIWEHYLYTGDKVFLKEYYPILKDAARFTLGWMVMDSSGHLVTSPATSPENIFLDNRKKSGLSIATTMDMGIIKDLFHNTIDAEKVLGIDAQFADSLNQALAKLLPYQIGKKGNLQEWYKDFDDVDPHHRHTSHLYALHPAHEISPFTTPELTAAAKKTLELRGDGGTGWSLAWKVNMWARLLDGNHAHLLFRNLLHRAELGGSGAYDNLFDAHPPFQIDGNFAGTAGITEMLLQSQNNELYLLPALPSTWQTGSINGIVGRGNFVVGINWDNLKLTTANVLSNNGGLCTIRSNQPITIVGTTIKSTPSTIGHILTFKTEKGKQYVVKGD